MTFQKCSIAGSLNNISYILTMTGRHAEAFPQVMTALNILLELQSPNVMLVMDTAVILRAWWGTANFDKAWQEARNEEVPTWFTEESEDTVLSLKIEWITERAPRLK